MNFSPKSRIQCTASGFTLAELLIVLLLLGIIATFTIPKILQANQQRQWNSGAKEAMSMVAAAYQAYINDNGTNVNMVPSALVPYMNYVTIDSVTSMDGPTGTAPWQCSWVYCIRLHNGALLYTNNASITFGQGSSNNMIYFLYDPDGKQTDGATSTAGNASLVIWLYYNGKIKDGANCQAGDIYYATGVPSACWRINPSWFSWN